jgi:HEPN domain-containing protein
MNEKIQVLKRWIEKGDHDLGTAMLTFKHIPKYKDTIAFHCQQAVEKYLKCYIYYLEIPVYRTHDLVFLLEQIDKIESLDEIWFD